MPMLQSIIKEYEDYSTKIDYANDIGNALDTTVSVGDRPMSPVRHSSREFIFVIVTGRGSCEYGLLDIALLPSSVFTPHVLEIV